MARADAVNADGAVPPRCRGVWVRTLLQTDAHRDDTSFVRWLQASHWHADLRLAHAAGPPGTAQGFCGVTSVDAVDGHEVCTWQRHVDVQPPRSTPDAGRIVFEGPDRLVETGVHGRYLEVWERLPGSTGRFVVLLSAEPPPGAPPTTLLVAGRWAMRVRPRSLAWPDDTVADESLRDVTQRHPALAGRLLDFEVSFGRLEHGRFTVDRSTLAGLEGSHASCILQRDSATDARVHGAGGSSRWQVLEWTDAPPCID